MSKSDLRIGGASAFWGDTSTGAAQLVDSGEVDVLIFDYLAEVTMSIMAGAKLKDPNAGFAPDFIGVLKPLLGKIKQQDIKVLSNAGGVNLNACATALRQVIAELELDLSVAVVDGDNLIERLPKLQPLNDMFSGEPLPERCLSFNAYLGAPAIRDALALGADIVITGRVADSALVLGPLMQHFGWAENDYDLLAQGSLAGHIIECGTQCCGGNFTDWQLVANDYADMGFPIAHCQANGDFIVSKPQGTGGLVSRLTVAEQLVYEIGDPKAYLLPDVICDFSRVQLEQLGENRVKITGATGLPPTTSYKASATAIDGFRCTASFVLAGIDANAKAKAVSQAILTKVNTINAKQGLSPIDDIDIELLGSEATYGPHAQALNNREVVVKMTLRHASKKALVTFTKEIAQASTAMAPGICGLMGGRPKVSPVIRLYSCLIDKQQIHVGIALERQQQAVEIAPGEAFNYQAQCLSQLSSTQLSAAQVQPITSGTHQVALVKLAVARSGDKGDHSNIGVIARRPEYLAAIKQALSGEQIAAYMAHILSPSSAISVFELPGIDGINILLENALGGGGMASLRIDPQGKALAQQLLQMPISIDEQLYNSLERDQTAG